METLKLHAKADQADFTVRIPASLQGQAPEILVVLQPIASPIELGWPEGFFEQTAGAWAGEPLERPEQGVYEEREAFRVT